jgi:hypothetical protein
VKTKDPITLPANKKKDGAPYTVTVGPHHYLVLTTLQQMPDLSDHEITFLNDVHMLAARRCELRDAGLVQQAGRNGFGMTWRLTDAGQRFLGGDR